MREKQGVICVHHCLALLQLLSGLCAESSGTDEECQAEFVVSSDDEDPGDDNGDATSEDTDSEWIDPPVPYV